MSARDTVQAPADLTAWEYASDDFLAAAVSWDIPFPASGRIVSQIRLKQGVAAYGVSVYCFSADVARFVIRGDLTDAEDLMACLAKADKLARQLGCCELVTQEKMRPDWLGTERVFRAGGFRQLDASFIFECPFNQLAIRSTRVMKILKQRGAIPREARVTDLREGRKLARFILEEALLMDGYDFDNRLEPGATKYISETYSQLVWLGSTLLGIILVAPTQDQDIYEIPIRFIMPSHRQTWVNALLIQSCVQRGEVMSAKAIRFNANADTHRETIRLAEQAGGTLIASSHRYGKSLPC